jgi:hypothetical protein
VSETRSDQSSFTAVLLERDGKFYFYQPGLAVIASGESVEGAYQKFLGARRNFIQEVENAGLSAGTGQPSTPTLPQPLKIRRARSNGIVRELGLFLAKMCIVLLIMAAIGAVAAVEVKRSTARLVASTRLFVHALTSGQSSLLSGIKSQTKISLVDILSKAAQHAQAMPEDRKEELRQSVGILSREAEPLIEAWRKPPPLPKPQADPASPSDTNSPGR